MLVITHIMPSVTTNQITNGNGWWENHHCNFHEFFLKVITYSYYKPFDN